MEETQVDEPQGEKEPEGTDSPGEGENEVQKKEAQVSPVDSTPLQVHHTLDLLTGGSSDSNHSPNPPSPSHDISTPTYAAPNPSTPSHSVHTASSHTHNSSSPSHTISTASNYPPSPHANHTMNLSSPSHAISAGPSHFSSIAFNNHTPNSPSHGICYSAVNPISAVGNGDGSGFVGGRCLLDSTNFTPRTVKENTDRREATEELRNDLYRKAQDHH